MPKTNDMDGYEPTWMLCQPRPDTKGHRLEKALKYGLCGAQKAAGTPFGTPKMQNYLVLFGSIWLYLKTRDLMKTLSKAI